jgi:hypothetical protein
MTATSAVRAKLVETLYTQPISLLIGALCGVAACGTAAFISGDWMIIAGATMLTLVGIARVTLAYWIAYQPRARDALLLERLYEAGAFSYALLSGVITARAIWVNASPNLDALMTTYAVAYGTGIAARNAGRPFIAATQLVLTVMPVVIACFLLATAELLVLGIASCAMIVAMLSVIMSVFRTLREQIIAAEASAQMAEQHARPRADRRGHRARQPRRASTTTWARCWRRCRRAASWR